MAREYRVALVGATGMVGMAMRKILEERDFPVAELRLLASQRSRGRRLPFRGAEVEVEVLDKDSFRGIDIALFSAGGDISRRYASAATAAGAVVIDNSSAFRMDDGVPLLVPEVNPEDAAGHGGIIANPNCSTIQLVVVLKPLHERSAMRRVVVSTYQAASGTGKDAVEELKAQAGEVLRGGEPVAEIYPHPIAFNCLPHIDAFLPGGHTREEMKMVGETRKIMDLPDLPLCATCVRVPVFRAHSEAIHAEFERPVTEAEARAVLAAAPGVRIVDDRAANTFPMPLAASGGDDTLVGRIRADSSLPGGLALFVAGDQIRKGAALNAVQIGEALLAARA